ncbi:MAG TPA: sulfatase [Methylomirabilota bacterium]|nr:sulfatase [Methylomirabilota bacterium]
MVVLLTGCGQTNDAKSGSLDSIRLMPEATETLASQAPIWTENEVFRWEFKTDADLAAWREERIGESLSIRSGGLYFRSEDADPSLMRTTSIDAERVDAIRVTQNGLVTNAAAQIFWTREGEIFAEARSLTVDRPDSNGSITPTFTFPVFNHEQWSGVVNGFRYDPTSVASQRVQVDSIVGVEYVPSDELLDQVVAKAWRVDYSGDTRYAVLAPPGRPYRRELKVPKAAKLELALGFPKGQPFSTRFIVSWRPKRGDEEILLNEVVSAPADPGSLSWLDRSIDLSRLAGRKGVLSFSTESSEPLEMKRSLPSFANITVAARTNRSPRQNVVMVVLDTLRADGLSCYGSEFDTSPHIDAWAGERGVLFENVVAPSPWTLPSHVSLFTGMDPVHHSMNVGEPIDASLTTLAEVLSSQDYATVAFTGGGYLSSEFALMQGFDRVHYFYEPKIRPRETGNDLVSGTERCLRWLEANRDRSFFMLFHTYEIHAPYRPREPYLSRFLGTQQGEVDRLLTTSPVKPVKETGYQLVSTLVRREPSDPPRYEAVDPSSAPLVRAQYASTVAYADAHIGQILEAIRNLGLEDDTIVVLTSDHGEALGERGLAGHATLQECEIMVPLVIAAPGAAVRGTRVRSQVQTVNIAPTILDLLRLDPLPESEARSLLPFLHGTDAGDTGDAVSYAGSSNFGLSLRRANHLKYHYNNSIWPANHGAERLYDLEDDPEATRDTAATSPKTAELRSQLTTNFESRFTGVRLALTNREDDPMHAILRGWLVNPLRVKSFDITTANIEWFSQQLELTLDPGQNVTFILEGAVTGELQLICEFPDAGTTTADLLNRTLDLARLESPWRAELRVGRWIETTGPMPESEATDVRVWIEGLRAAARSSSGVSDATKEQLRQLGYVVD